MPTRSVTFDRIAGRIPASAFAGDESSARALLISCVDGCMPEGSLAAHLRMDELIAVRNPANLVPCHGKEGLDQTVESALARGVRELIVCGHAGCSMIARLLDPRTALDDLALAAWLDHAEAVHQAVRVLPPGERHARAVELNIAQQLAHLRAHPPVAAGLLAGRLRLHGWLFDPVRDVVLARDPQTTAFTRRAALDPTQNSLFRRERLRAGPSLPLPTRDPRARYLA